MLSTLFALEDPVRAQQNVWTQLASEHVDGYRLIAADTEVAFDRIETPVSQHVQSVRGNATGSVYVWQDKTGRPVAVCDVFFLPRTGDTFQLYDEWHSLTSESMTAERNGELRWSPSEPGIDWQVIPDAGVPAETASRRTLQLRGLSRRFSAHIITRDDERYELRMLPTPIFRYDTSATNASLGGGIFAFCQGNDPETLLVIEARKHDDGYRWEYAAAEFSNLSQFLLLDDETVWKADPPQFRGDGRHMGGSLYNVEVPARNRE